MVPTAVEQGKLVFAVEPFAQCYVEAQELLKLHWEEIAKDKKLLFLNPDVDLYNKLSARTNIVVVTARTNAKLVGYFVWFLAKHPHYKHVLVAEEDIHFLLPEYRKGLNGYLLAREAVSLVKPLGVRYFRIREKIGHEHPALMKRLGFLATDVTYTLALDGD